MPTRHTRPATACLALLACLLFALAAPVRAEELTQAKQADIKRLIEMSGTVTAITQMVGQLGDQAAKALRQKRPDASERVLEIVRREVRGVLQEKLSGPGGLLERLVPLYGRTFTHQEVREMLAFYSSPTGRKAAASLPGLMAEGRALGEQLGREIAPELKRRIEDALRREGQGTTL